MLPPASGAGGKMQNLSIISHWGWGGMEAASLTVLIASPLHLLSVPFAQQQMKPIHTHYCFLIEHIDIFEVILTAMIVCSFYFSVQYHRTTYYRLTLSSVLTLGSIRWDAPLPVSMPQSWWILSVLQVANSNLTVCGNSNWPSKSLLCNTISLKGTNLEKTGSPRCPQGVCVLYNVSLADFTSGSLLLSQSQHLRWFAILGPNIQHYWLKVCEIREVSINKFGFSFFVSSGKISQNSLVVRSRLGLIKSKWTQD